MFYQTAFRVRDECRDDHALGARIRGEYQEMPGLSLTLPQAARLFNVASSDCARVLDRLVTDGALWTNGCRFLCRNVGRSCV